MLLNQSVLITEPLNRKYYSGWLDGEVYTQSVAPDPVQVFMVLDVVPLVAGSYNATVFEDTDVFESTDYFTDVPVTYEAIFDGLIEDTGEVVSDEVTEFTLTAETTIGNVHGRGIMRRHPTGSAWHGRNYELMVNGLATEIRRLELETNEKASIRQMLFGDNLRNWQRALSLTPAGTIEQQEKAVIRKLSDTGGLRAEDITTELQEAGFDLYAYANKFPVDIQAEEMSLDLEMALDLEMSKKTKFLTNDPQNYRYSQPMEQMALDLEMSLDLEMGFYDTGGDLVINNISDEAWGMYLEHTWNGFFIVCGDEFMKPGECPEERRRELRELLLGIKELKSIAILIINYT